MKLVIEIVERREYGYTAWCPALPGCRVNARTSEEARSRIAEAAKGYLASMDSATPLEIESRFRSGLRPAKIGATSAA